jgi:hypothetical protein
MPLPECDFCTNECTWIVSNPGGQMTTTTFCDEHWPDFVTTMADAVLSALQADLPNPDEAPVAPVDAPDGDPGTEDAEVDEPVPTRTPRPSGRTRAASSSQPTATASEEPAETTGEVVASHVK